MKLKTTSDKDILELTTVSWLGGMLLAALLHMSDVEKKNNMLFRKEEFYALIVVFILFGVPIIGLVSILFPG